MVIWLDVVNNIVTLGNLLPAIYETISVQIVNRS